MPSLLRAAAAVTSVALLATACSSTAGERSDQDTLRIVGPFEIHSFQPSASSGLFTRLQVVETLVASDLAGELTPGLSPSWSTSRDQRTWTFDLPTDVTFHDGTPVTPEAVAASLELAAADEASPLAAAPIKKVRGADEAVQIELTSAHPALPALLTHYSSAVHAPSAYDEKGTVTQVVGTGPYRVTRAELPSSVETTRFADWRGEAPTIANVSFQSVPRAESRALMATSGQADVVFGLEPAGRDRVEGTDGVGMVSSLQPRTLYLKVNGEHEALGDVRVRRALSLALDREAIAHAVLRERDLAATQLFPPSLAAWHDPDLEPLTHDPERARELLLRAGFTEASGGTLSRDGRPLRITLTSYPDRPELPALATAVQAAWRDIGVDLTVDVTNSSEIPARHQDGTLDVGLLARHLALVSDPLVTVADTFAPRGSDWGAMRWQDQAVTEAVEQLLVGDSEAREEELRSVISGTAQEELPVIPVAWYRMNAAVSEQVEGFVLDPLEHTWRLTEVSWR